MKKSLFSSIFLLSTLGLPTPWSLLYAEDEQVVSKPHQSVTAPKLSPSSALGKAIVAHVSGAELGGEEDLATSAEIAAKKISLKEAIVASLDHNPDFAIVRLEPEVQRQAVLEAEGQYDTFLSAGSDWSRMVEPSSSALLGTDITTKDFNFSIGLDQKLVSGADVSLSWDNKRQENNSRFTSLSPSYASSLNLKAEQPLLKGTGWGSPRTVIRIRRSLRDASLAEYEANVAQQIRNVVEAYWSEVLARKVLDVRRKDLQLSKRLKRDSEEGVKVGLLAPLALSEASSQVALSKEAYISAKNDLENAGRVLRQTVGYDFDDGSTEEVDFSPLTAADELKYEPVEFVREDTVQKALTRRAELKAQALREKSADLNLKLSSNSVLPTLNLQGKVGVNGLAGQQRVIDGFGSSNEPSPFEGDYYDSLDTLDSGDYYQYSVGVRLQVPLENRQARARYNESKIQVLREKNRSRSLRQSIIEETLRALSDLESSSKRVRAGEEAVKFSTDSLNVSRDKFQAGLATIRNVLETQRDLSAADLRLAQAQRDFQVALIEVYRAKGELLERFDLSLEG